MTEPTAGRQSDAGDRALTSVQGLEIIRGCRGLDLVGCDLVEVARPRKAPIFAR